MGTRQGTLDKSEPSWGPGPDKVVVGKDVLELLSTSMYVDPLTIYREYIQNAADAIDEARTKRFLSSREAGRVDIEIDAASRSIRIRDNGTGIPWAQFVERISNLGASAKRGTSARGFRGVGRLAGLGYCQELIFRSRAPGETSVSELRWDCRKLKAALRASQAQSQLSELIKELVSVRKVPARSGPARFFEVEMRGVIRHRNDRLLNANVVGEYLAQVAPIPFSPSFRFGEKISTALDQHVALGQLEIYINGSQDPLYRPHANRVEIGQNVYDKYSDLELHEVPGIDGNVAAVAWVLHHGYYGALPNATLVKGLRFRTGNLQVGENALLEEFFPEPRFNAWAVGEIHILDSRVIPNGRRDHFEQNTHFDNVLNHLGPIIRDISRRCRQSSIHRKWLRDFDLQKTAAMENARSVRRRGISKSARGTYTRAATKALEAMEKIAGLRHLEEGAREKFLAETKSTKASVSKLLSGALEKNDPFARFKPQAQAAYRQVIQLIYDCASNGAAAQKLVDKILDRIESGPKERRNPAKKVKRAAVHKSR